MGLWLGCTTIYYLSKSALIVLCVCLCKWKSHRFQWLFGCCMGAGLKWCVIKCRSFGMPMCLWLEKGGHQNPNLFFLMKSIWKVLLSVALNHSPLQRSLTANFTKHPPEQADYKEMRVALVCANSSNSHESVFTCHHTEDTNCWCCFFFLGFVFFFDNLV